MKYILLLTLMLSACHADAAWKCIKQKDEKGKTVAMTCGKSTIIELYIKNGIPNPVLKNTTEEAVLTIEEKKAPATVKLDTKPTSNGLIGIDANGRQVFK